MNKFRLIVAGEAAPEGADEFRRVLGAADDTELSRVAALPEDDRKAVDPIALAALVLSVPSTVLAVIDIADRIAKRRRASDVIATAERLRVEKKVETYVIAADGPRSLRGMSSDRLLEIANGKAAPTGVDS